jgi:polyhydroxyalkanoate synthesis regulator phasin
MMGSAYLFWRVSEGGVPFQTSMPPWRDVLSEQERWDVINYIRALGSGRATPVSATGGQTYDPATQAALQAEMLAKAVEQGVISQEEANLFAFVHDAVDDYRAAHPDVTNQYTDATERENAILSALVEAGTITQAQADAFNDIHDRIGSAGLMQ